MYISSIGRTRFGALPEQIESLMAEAILKALVDSRIKLKDIECVIVSNALSALTHNQEHLSSVVYGILKKDIPIIRVEATCASGGVAFYNAVSLLPRFRHILVVGAEKMADTPSPQLSRYIGSSSERHFDLAEGFIFPVGGATLLSRYKEAYGDPTDALTQISLKNHENANLNPYAQFYGKQISLEKVTGSKKIVGDIRLLDCSPTSDGAVALVVSRDKVDDRSISILSSEIAMGDISLSQSPGLSLPAQRKAVGKALVSAGIKREEIEMLEIHDGYTIVELFALEDLGFARPGEAPSLIAKGHTRRDGKLPVNTNGGLKADGHPLGATGLCHMHEIVTQLRGEAGARQVKARTAMSHNIGGLIGTCAVSIFRRE